MNRREFMTVLGGASALSVINVNPTFGASGTTSLYVKGLIMVDFGNPGFVRLGMPKAPGHKATLGVVPDSGPRMTMNVKGTGKIDGTLAASADPRIAVPELVRMKELYGAGIKSHVDQCPSVISIPSAAIQSITTTELSPVRYTFVRRDNGEEVTSFRPRQIAETIKIDLSSAGTLKLDSGKVSIPLETARELRLEYGPERNESLDPFVDHFNHYLDYIERPAALDFNVLPRKVNGSSSASPKVALRFVDYVAWCYLVAVP
jgi:hypothetical protein